MNETYKSQEEFDKAVRKILIRRLMDLEKLSQEKAEKKADRLIKDDKFSVVPSGNFTSVAMNTMAAVNCNESAIESMKNISKMQMKHNRHSEYHCGIEDTPEGKRLVVRYKSDTDDITLVFTNVLNTLQKSNNNGTTAKFFLYLLSAINKKLTVNNSGINFNQLTLSLKDVQNDMGYSRTTTARKALEKAVDDLITISYKGTIKRKGKKGNISTNTWGHMFLKVDEQVERGYFKIWVDNNIYWDLITPFFTIIPKEAYQLSTKAFFLMFAIAKQCRMDTMTTDEEGNLFTTIYRHTLIKELALPVSDTRNFSFFVKKPLETAIEEIENKFSNLVSFEDIETNTHKKNSIEQYTNSKLKIIVKNDFKEYFLHLGNQKKRAQRRTYASKKKKSV